MSFYRAYSSGGVKSKFAKNKGAYGWVDLEPRIDMQLRGNAEVVAPETPNRRPRAGPMKTPEKHSRAREPLDNFRITPWEAAGAGGMMITPFLTPGRRRRGDAGDLGIGSKAAAMKNAARPKHVVQWGGSSGSGGSGPPKPPPVPPIPKRNPGTGSTRIVTVKPRPKRTAKPSGRIVTVKPRARPADMIVDRNGQWWQQEVAPWLNKGKPPPVPIVPEAPPNRVEQIKSFIKKHGVETAVGIAGAAALGLLGGPAGLAAGGAALGEGIEMGALAEPLMGWGAGRVAARGAAAAGPGLANRLANFVARRHGWDVVERVAGADNVDYWMI